MSNLVSPHGADSLQPLLLPETERAEEARRAKHEPVPAEFSRAEAIAVLQEYYEGPGRQ